MILSAKNMLMISGIVILGAILTFANDYIPSLKEFFIQHYRSINRF